MTAYSHLQKQILQKLLSKYEYSKTYKGENSISQSFTIKPSDIFKEYEKDSADINEVIDFEKQCKLLESENFIQIDWKYDRIKRIVAICTDENWNKIRTILGVKDKNTRLKEEIAFFSKFYEETTVPQIVKTFCKTQIEKLEAGKNAEYSQEESKEIIALLTFIFRNKNEILERELSISVLSNSKTWESKYKTKVLRILKKSGNFDSLIENCIDEKEVNKAILEEFNIFANPSYVYFKGNGTINFENGKSIIVYSDIPVALTSSSIKGIISFEIFDSRVMTVENLTSFNRINNTDTFYFFLSGYHNSAKQTFLKKIYNQNSDKKYYHFGDIDPDGFYILENLRNKTDIDFKPYKMGITELEKYSAFSKVLEENDKIKAKTLIGKGCYTEIIEYMLKHDRKLEQEIISWKEG
ncbi:MAG: hypothetical protein J5857_05430 [Treponema sp.]|nr:hypothetical protein [Treponema sp.]